MGFFTHDLVTNITIGSNVRCRYNSMYEAFHGCYNLNQPITIPNSVTNMANTFYGCSNFNQPITIPNGVTDMSYTFYGCTNFNQTVNIPNSVTSTAYMFASGSTTIPNIYVYSGSVTNVLGMFAGYASTFNKTRHNIFVPGGSTTNTAFHNNYSNGSITGASITWTWATNVYYNTAINVYVYYNKF